MTPDEARDQATVAKAIQDRAEGRYAPPNDHGVGRAFGAFVTLGLTELNRDEHSQEIYNAAHSAAPRKN